jgi:large subunit ribosomal protein L17
MRHRKAGLKLNRTSSHRNAMFRNMVTSLFKHDRIRTTDAKAKELRRWADKMVTLAKRGDLHARRQVLSIMMEKNVVHKLFEEASDRFGSINGGYTRLVKLGTRPGDAASVTLVELVSLEKKAKKKTKKKTKSGTEKKVEVTKAPEPETEQEPVEAKEPESTSAKEPEPEPEEAKPEEAKPATEEKAQNKTTPEADEKDTDVTEKDASDEKESAAKEGADKQEE